MAKNLMKRPKKKLIVRLLLPMLLMVLFQLITFFAILILGGEFTYVKQYAYSTFAEKTETRRNYIETEFQQKVPSVIESADKIGSMIADIFEEQNASAADIQTNKNLDRIIVESSVDSLIDLLRRSKVNDVYLILETGDLYNSDNSDKSAKAAIYIRDLDIMTDAGYEDLLMEIGFSSISQNFGISLDSGWTLHFESDPNDTANFDFYYKTMNTAEENPSAKLEYLGYWSGFSKFARNAAASMKYTVPLIAEDGTVYGVLGIGLTENTILEELPASDFKSEIACYVLGNSRTGDVFDIVTHSGIAFQRLVGKAESLNILETMEEDICGFDIENGSSLTGSIQDIDLYSQASPYYGDFWALIAVADRSSVLKPYTNLIQMLFIAAIISLAISIVVVFFTSRNVVKPITEAIRTMNSNRKYSEVIRFEPSNIYELDNMTDAITQLQINVQSFSSQVSQMIRMADVGLGTFLYDSDDDSVFVGQSLLKQLDINIDAEEDVLMSRLEFLESIAADETRIAITEGFDEITKETQNDYIKEYSIAQRDCSMLWMRLSLVNNKNKSIGILQDITTEIMEKKRIEYERDYDSATGLLNRNAYYNQVEKLFQNTDSLKVTAFIMLDLDNLKYVNDTYGHDFGDDYIKTAATSLKRFQFYGGIVSRLSGDEFNVCLSGFSSKDEIREIIENVRSQLLQSYCLLADGTHFKIRASMGVSWYPDDAKSYEVLMKYADFAMYTIKHSTKGELAEFDRSAYDSDSILITGVEEMNRIIDECSVRYAFHSIVNAKTGEIYGYEALMRPQSTVFQSPLDLLRIAKNSARLYEIERMTWTRALADFKTQMEAGRISEGCHVFVNSLSNCVLERSDIESVEKEYEDILPNVVLEILEGESVNEEYNDRKIKRMKKWGAQIALDDFGTGYNSEYALITLQPNIIKIDRSIISGCDKDISRRTIISNLVRLVKAKNILILAEGVETEDELQTVISCGVDLLQGYYFNRPLFEPEPLKPEVTEKIRHMANPSFQN